MAIYLRGKAQLFFTKKLMHHCIPTTDLSGSSFTVVIIELVVKNQYASTKNRLQNYS